MVLDVRVRVVRPKGLSTRLDEIFETGEASSPVRLLLYVSVGDGRHGDLVVSLCREVQSGRLKGKVKLAMRPIVAKGMGDATARALIAAAGQGMLWPYAFRLLQERGPFQEHRLKRWASMEGLDGDAFDLAFDDVDTAALVEALATECIRAHADAAPSAFVDGVRLTRELTLEELVGALEKEYVRSADQGSSDRRP